MHLGDTFIQSDLQWIQAILFLSVCLYLKSLFAKTEIYKNHVFYDVMFLLC